MFSNLDKTDHRFLEGIHLLAADGFASICKAGGGLEGIQGLNPKLENHRITPSKREMHKIPAMRKVLLSGLVRLQ